MLNENDLEEYRSIIKKSGISSPPSMPVINYFINSVIEDKHKVYPDDISKIIKYCFIDKI